MSLAVVLLCLDQVGVGFYGCTVLVILNFFFLGFFKDFNVFSFNFSILTKLVDVLINSFYRLFLSTFFIFCYDILLNLDTCKYDSVLRCLLMFMPFFLFFVTSVSIELASFKKGYFWYLTFFFNFLELVFVSSTILFFIFGFFKLFFVKYILITMFVSMFLLLVSARLALGITSQKNEK